MGPSMGEVRGGMKEENRDSDGHNGDGGVRGFPISPDIIRSESRRGFRRGPIEILASVATAIALFLTWSVEEMG